MFKSHFHVHLTEKFYFSKCGETRGAGMDIKKQFICLLPQPDDKPHKSPLFSAAPPCLGCHSAVCPGGLGLLSPQLPMLLL